MRGLDSPFLIAVTQADSAPRAQKSKRRRHRRPAAPKPRRALAAAAAVMAAAALAASGYLIYANEIGPRLAGDGDAAADLAGVESRLAAVERRLGAQGDSAAAIERLTSRIAQVENADATAAAAELQTVRGEISALQSASREREQAALREIHGLADALAQLQIDAARNAGAWRLAEAEHLLIIANQRLQLGGDVAVARRALALADDILRDLADPGLGAVRGFIAEEVAALEQAARVDVAGVLHRLAALARQVDALPLAGEVRVGAAAASTVTDATGTGTVADATVTDGWWAAGKTLLADLGDLVQVESIDADAPPPLLPAETRALIRANAALLVEAAGLAFLRADAAVYAERMQAAGAWVTAHFDANADATRDWQARRTALAAAPVAAQWPDISRSLRALRAAAGR